MANSTSHAALPYPIKNARFSIALPFRVAAGTPTDPGTPDTEFSTDGGATFNDCAEEITTGGANGMGYLTLTGAETNNNILLIAGKSANDLTTPAILYPRVLAAVGTGTLSAGSAGGGTLGTLLAYDVTGCFIQTTGGTGGGGTGGANNQARKMVTYNTSTGAFTVTPNWETTPSTDTTYSVLLPEGVTLGMLKTLNPTTPGNTLDVSSGGEAGMDWANIGSKTTTNALTGTTIATTQKVDVDTIKTNPVVNGGTITFPTTATLASTTNITAATGIDVTKWAGGTIVSPNITGLPLVDVKGFIGTTLTETSAGYIAAAFKHFFDVTSAAMTAAGVNQTGDSYPIVSSGTYGNSALNTTLGTIAGYVDTEVAAIKAKTDNLPASFPSNFAALGIGSGGHILNVDTLTTYTGNTPQTADNAAAGTRTLLALPAVAPDALGGLGTTRSGNKVWFYDAVNGSDANSGLSDNAALQTISAVCSVAKAGHVVIVLSASGTVTGNQTISTSGVRWYFQSSAIFTATSGTTIAITGHDNEFHNPTWRTTDATNGWPFSLAANTRNNKMFGGNIGSNNIGLDACSIAGAINFYAEGTTFTNPYDTIYGVSASARFVGCKFVMSASYSSGSPPDYSTIICDGSTVTFENCRTVIIKAAGNVTTGDVSVFRINAGDPLQGSLRVINHTAQVEIDEATQVCNVHLLKIMGSYPAQAHIEGGNFISYNLGAASITTLTIKADSDDYVEVKGLSAPRSWTGNVLWPTDDAAAAASQTEQLTFTNPNEVDANASVSLSPSDIQDIADAVAASIGSVSPFTVDKEHTWKFAAKQNAASNIIKVLIGFDGILAMDFDTAIPARTSLASITSAVFTNITGTEPTISASAVSADRRSAHITVDTSAATANTYTLTVTGLTADSQTFVLTGQLNVA